MTSEELLDYIESEELTGEKAFNVFIKWLNYNRYDDIEVEIIKFVHNEHGECRPLLKLTQDGETARLFCVEDALAWLGF